MKTHVYILYMGKQCECACGWLVRWQSRSRRQSRARRPPTSHRRRRAMVKRTREERRRFLTKAHAAIAAGLLTPRTSPTTMRTCHRQLRCAFANEGVSCESGRGLGNERATRAGMASGVRASGTSSSTVRTSKTIRCCGKSSNRDFEFLTLCFVSWRTR